MPFAVTSAGRVFYQERGSGLPVVLLHATLHDHRDFDLVAGPLAERYRTIAVDWPGHGRSDLGGQAVDAFLLARVLAEIAEDLDLPPAVLIGNSVGGFAAARLALDQPHRVAGLVLVNTAGFTVPTAGGRLATRLLGSPRVSRRLFPRLVPGYMKPQNSHDRAIAERARARACTADGARIAASLWRSFGAPGYDLRADGPSLAAPTLLVWGARDTILPLKAGRQASAAIPGAQFRTLDTGHVVFASDLVRLPRPGRALHRVGPRAVTTRQQRAAATRQHIVDAGLELAEQTGLAGMSINLIVEKAGVAKGTFFHHFGDRARFLVALHREFHDRLFAEITEAVAGMRAGRGRLLAAAAAYLDGCLRHRGIRALLLEARAEPLIATAIAQRNQQVIRLITPDFAAIGWTDPADGAALWNALVVEAALLELADGERRPATRNALAQFLPP